MKVDSTSIRSFVASYQNFNDNNINLDELVLKYRETNDSRYFATIYNRVLGCILKIARGSFHTLGLSEDDIFSEAMTSLYYALRADKGWKPGQSTTFLTYYTWVARNAILTLQNRKCQRDYQKYNTSLDDLLSENEEEETGVYQFTEADSISNHIKVKKESPLIALHKLMAQFDNVKEQLAFNLGVSLPKLELILIAAKIKLNKSVQKNKESLITSEEEHYFNAHKKDYKELKKILKNLV